MASEKKVSAKTWRILAKNDARSTPFEQLGNLLPLCIKSLALPVFHVGIRILKKYRKGKFI